MGEWWWGNILVLEKYCSHKLSCLFVFLSINFFLLFFLKFQSKFSVINIVECIDGGFS